MLYHVIGDYNVIPSLNTPNGGYAVSVRPARTSSPVFRARGGLTAVSATLRLAMPPTRPRAITLLSLLALVLKRWSVRRALA